MGEHLEGVSDEEIEDIDTRESFKRVTYILTESDLTGPQDAEDQLPVDGTQGRIALNAQPHSHFLFHANRRNRRKKRVTLRNHGFARYLI